MYPGITSRSLPCAYRTNEIRNANENSFSRGYVWKYPPVLVICIPYADNATHITVHSPVQRRPALLKNKPVRQGSSIQPFSGLFIEVIFFYEILDHRQQAEKIPPKGNLASLCHSRLFSLVVRLTYCYCSWRNACSCIKFCAPPECEAERWLSYQPIRSQGLRKHHHSLCMHNLQASRRLSMHGCRPP